MRIAGFDANGGETVPAFRVNDYTSNYQWDPHLAELANGDIAIGWNSRGQDGSGDGVFGKILSGADLTTEVMGESRLSGSTSSTQNIDDLTALADGGFAIGYHSAGIDGSGDAAMLRAFSASGAETVAETQVNTGTYLAQTDVQVAPLYDGAGG